MECRDVVELSVLRLAGEIAPEERGDLDRHLLLCPSCLAEFENLRTVWNRLRDDVAPLPTAAFEREALGRMREATLRRRPVRLGPSAWWIGARRVAALLVVGLGGFFVAKLFAPAGPAAFPRDVPAGLVVPVENRRVVDVSRAMADLSGNPRLANVTYQAPDAGGRIAVSFDVTTRYTVVGRPDQKGIEDVLAYVVAGGGATEGARGKALDLVSQNLASGTAAPSSEILSVLAKTLTSDRNPGVRKKAAEALAQLPPTPETRDAMIACLKTEGIPGIRMIAVEGLAKAAATLRDRTSIETLQEKANDERESGYVRVKAASALGRMAL